MPAVFQYMRHQELFQDTYENLIDIYGEDRVIVEPVVEERATLRPDIVVLDKEQDEFYVIVECSTLTSQHREREDLKQLRQLMEATGAPYGALVSESMRYVFELVESDGDKVERELPSFPVNGEMNRRAFESAEEIRFKFWRLAEHFRGEHPTDLIKELYYALFRKLVADRHNPPLNVDNLTPQDLREIDSIIQEEYPPYKTQCHRCRSALPGMDDEQVNQHFTP